MDTVYGSPRVSLCAHHRSHSPRDSVENSVIIARVAQKAFYCRLLSLLEGTVIDFSIL